jgi:DNA-binding transcriptional ArsR family regulator
MDFAPNNDRHAKLGTRVPARQVSLQIGRLRQLVRRRMADLERNWALLSAGHSPAIEIIAMILSKDYFRPMPLTQRRISSAHDMRALAHPLRMDLLELLAVHGAHTASEAAAVLDQTPANVSWHLRKLAEHGFVRQAADGPGRRRPWKMIAESLSWGDDAADPAAVAALSDLAIEREVQRLRAAIASSPRESHDWQRATQVHQSRLWLTSEEAAELGAAIGDLLHAYDDRLQEPASRPDGARLMASLAWVVPNGPADDNRDPS